MKRFVYLAGPITGLTYEGCTDWRDAFRSHLAPGIIGVSPMRHKEYLAGRGEIVATGYGDAVLNCDRGVVTRDHMDVHKCDALLVNLLGATRVSIGSMFEMAWAFEKRIPIIAVIEREGNIHEHCFVKESTGFRVETLEQAADTINKVLGVYAG